MVIKLIQPKMVMRPMDTRLKTRMAPALGLLTIAGMLEKEHTVIIENENVEAVQYDKSADLVGITVTVDVMERAAQIAKRFREMGIPVAAGGIHVTAFPEECEKYFDVVCVGMAEGTWPDMIKDFQKGTLKKRYKCKGNLTGRDIRPPAYHMIDSSQYLYCNIISTSRGCPFHCDFCYNSCDAYKKMYINRSVGDVIRDIKVIGKRHIMFIDDNFIGNPEWTRKFVRAIKPMNLIWNCAVSANIVDMPDLLDEMKEAGCQSMFIGFESINENSISGVHKGQNQVNQFDRLVEELHSRGIMINASFVFGLDGDDSTTFKKTVDWIVEHKIETVTSHILTPYPGTAVYDRYDKAGRITDYNFSKYNTANVVFRPKHMTAEELYEGYLWVYDEVYSFKNIIKRLPREKKQWKAYLLFNFLYRKWGSFTEKLCDLVTYERIGKIAEKISYQLPVLKKL